MHCGRVEEARPAMFVCSAGAPGVLHNLCISRSVGCIYVYIYTS